MIWTKQEVKLLIKKYPITRNELLFRQFLGRTPRSISRKAEQLRLYKTQQTKFETYSVTTKKKWAAGKNGCFSVHYTGKNFNQKKYNLEYFRMRRATDSKFRVLSSLRARLGAVVKAKYKKYGTKKLIGVTLDLLKAHLEKQFKPGMNWNNYGSYWEIDHIKPCCSFDLSKPSEQRKCFNYKNLQPLTIKENRRKGGVYVKKSR